MNRSLAFVLLFVLAINANGQLSPSLDSRLQFLLDSVCSKHHIKGASAAVLLPGSGIWNGVFGVSEVNQSITPDMLFGIGSNTKTYIATLLLKSQENGLLDLDDPIGNWLPAHPNIDNQITIRQLLNHTSGLYNYTNSIPLNNDIATDFSAIWEPEDILPYIEAPLFSPGSSWSYCNTNYLLAGLILKEVYIQSLSAILRDQILNPLGLSNTFLYPEETPVLPMANIWTINFNNNYLEDIITDYGYNHNATFSMAWAAGGIIATAEDNVKFFDKLMSGQIISIASLNEMKTFIPLSATRSYGLGLFKTNNFNGRVIYGHGGTNLGYINENAYDPLNGACISVLTNQDSISNSIILSRLVSVLHKAVMTNPLDIISSDNSRIQTYNVFPNPATEYINVTGINDETHIVLYDISGKKLIDQTSIKPSFSYHVGDLEPGLYMLEIADKSNGRKETRKVIIE